MNTDLQQEIANLDTSIEVIRARLEVLRCLRQDMSVPAHIEHAERSLAEHQARRAEFQKFLDARAATLARLEDPAEVKKALASAGKAPVQAKN